MKLRELILWILVIAVIALCVMNWYFIMNIFKLIKVMGETQMYILELIDIRSGWMLL